MSSAGPLANTDWLAAHLGDTKLRIADASWYLPQAGRNARAEYEAAHIPGAVFFDIDAISDPGTDLPHMLPEPAHFAAAMSKLGIANADMVVFYDGAGVYSAPRALWMLRAMGHENAAVLDGGLPKWRREGRPTSAVVSTPATALYTPRLNRKMIRNFSEMQANLAARTEQVADARSPARFRGREAEPRPGVRPGHMPHAVNIHYANVLTPDGTMRPPRELEKMFVQCGVDLMKPIVTSCGSGVTAAILSLAFELAGAKATALYDGSWAEWGARADAPVETG